MKIVKHPLPAELQMARKRFLRLDDMKALIEEASGMEAVALEECASIALEANTATLSRELPPKFWFRVQEAQKWANFKKALEEMTDESYSFGKFTITTQ